MYAVMAMLLGPSLTGILLTAFLDGKAGIREFLSRLFKEHAWKAIPATLIE